MTKYVLLVCFYFMITVSFAKDIYLIIGQSNAAGRAIIEPNDQIALSGVDILNNNNTWEAAVNTSEGLNRYSSIRKTLTQGLNFAYTFGRTVHESTGHDIGLIVNARGGTKIEHWKKGAVEGYYDSLMMKVNIVLSAPGDELKGILWHQGEGNRYSTTYLTDLDSLISDLRIDLGIPNLPFIVGQLSKENTDNATFNLNLQSISNVTNYTDWVDSECLKTSDGTHFDSNGQRILGYRYASKVLQMIYGFQLQTAQYWVIEDAYIRKGANANINYGLDEFILTKNLDTLNSDHSRMGLLKFDLSQAIGQVVDAKLVVHGEIQAASNIMDVSLYDTDTNWSETTVTFTNSPVFGSTPFRTDSINADSMQTIEICMCEYVKEKLDSVSNISIGFRGEELDIQEMFKFTSKDDTANYTKRPHLIIDYLLDTSSVSIRELPHIEKNSDLMIYPVPASKTITIQSERGISDIKIYTISGQLIFSTTNKGNTQKTNIMIGFLSPGAYIITTKSPLGIYTSRTILVE